MTAPAKRAAGIAALVTLGLGIFAFVVLAVTYALVKLGGIVLLAVALVVGVFLILWLAAYRDITTRGDAQ